MGRCEVILCGAAYRYNERAFKEYNVLSRRGLIVAIVGVGVWPGVGCNWVGGAHKSAIKLCLPPETCKLYAKRKQLSTTGIWHLCEVNVNNNSACAPCIYHSGVELYPESAVHVCTCVSLCVRVCQWC